MPRVFAVILNWNGAQDTLNCLETLRHQTFRDLRVVVVDNGSQDDSIDRIEAWARAHSQGVVVYERSEAQASPHQAGDPRFVLINAGENLGFAAGSNVGFRYAIGAGAELVFLLNNDTLLAPDVVEILAGFLATHDEYAAVTGQIRYLGRPYIWNCGGDLTWFGSRTYLYGEQPVETVPQTGWRRISFITGCAALIRVSVLEQDGLFTERFFFGEEDYEFSLRLKRAGRPIACCLEAVIQHRVGSSIDRAVPAMLGRYYLYYLNRFIDMREHYSMPFWWFWRVASLAVVIAKLKRSRGVSWRALAILGRRLLLDSSRLDGVSRERFETASRSGLDSL